MSMLLECSPAPWSVETVNNRDGQDAMHWVEDADSQTVCDLYVAPLPEAINPFRNAEANATLIAHAPDWPLIWWAVRHGDWIVRDDIRPGHFRMVYQGWHYSLDIYWLDRDPFGFPILTPELRARLKAEMEEAE